MTRFALAIDLGGTELRAAVVSDAGIVVVSAGIRTDPSAEPDVFIDRMAALALDVRASAPRCEIAGLGVGAPGPLDSIAGLSLAPPTLPLWRDVPLRAMLAARLQMPVWVENDANVAALGEWRFGAGRGTQTMVYVTVSTGLGGGVVADGRLLHGRKGLASHIGHMRIAETSEEPCSCGASGCWEALASATALGLRVARRARDGKARYIASLAGETPPNSRHVVLAARAGDREALDLLAEEASYLGIGFANLLHLYSPEKIVVGGGLGISFELMRQGAEAAMLSRAMPAYRDVPVVVAELGGQAGLVGAASLVLTENG